MNEGKLKLIRALRDHLGEKKLDYLHRMMVKSSILQAGFELVDAGANKILPLHDIITQIYKDRQERLELALISRLVREHIHELVDEKLLIYHNSDVYEITDEGLEEGAGYKSFIEQYRRIE